MSEKIIVIGAGYVGLVAGACFASAGFQVGMVESNPQKLKLIKDSQVPFYEPGLSELLKEGIASKRLSFFSNQKDALENLNAKFVFVPLEHPKILMEAQILNMLMKLSGIVHLFQKINATLLLNQPSLWEHHRNFKK